MPTKTIGHKNEELRTFKQAAKVIMAILSAKKGLPVVEEKPVPPPRPFLSPEEHARRLERIRTLLKAEA